MKNDEDETYDQTIPMNEDLLRDIEYLDKCIDRIDDECYFTVGSLEHFDWEQDQEQTCRMFLTLIYIFWRNYGN